MTTPNYDRLVTIINNYCRFNTPDGLVYIGNPETNMNILNSFIDASNNKDIFFENLKNQIKAIDSSTNTQFPNIRFNDNINDASYNINNINLDTSDPNNVHFTRSSDNSYYLDSAVDFNYRCCVQLLDLYNRLCDAKDSSYISTMNEYLKTSTKQAFDSNASVFNWNYSASKINYSNYSNNISYVIMKHIWLNTTLLSKAKTDAADQDRAQYFYRSPQIFFQAMRLFYVSIVQMYNVALTQNLASKLQSVFNTRITQPLTDAINAYNAANNTKLSTAIFNDLDVNIKNMDWYSGSYTEFYNSSSVSNVVKKLLDVLNNYQSMTDSTTTTFTYTATNNSQVSVNLTQPSNNPLINFSLNDIQRFYDYNYYTANYFGTKLNNASFNKYKMDYIRFKLNESIKTAKSILGTELTDKKEAHFGSWFKSLGSTMMAVIDCSTKNVLQYNNGTSAYMNNSYQLKYTEKKKTLSEVVSNVADTQVKINSNIHASDMYKNDAFINMILYYVSIGIIILVITGMTSIPFIKEENRSMTLLSLLAFVIMAVCIFYMVEKLFISSSFETFTQQIGGIENLLNAGIQYLEYSSNYAFYDNTLLPAMNKEYKRMNRINTTNQANYNKSELYVNDQLQSIIYYKAFSYLILELAAIVIIAYLMYINSPGSTALITYVVIFLFMVVMLLFYWNTSKRYRTSFRHELWRGPKYNPNR